MKFNNFWIVIRESIDKTWQHAYRSRILAEQFPIFDSTTTDLIHVIEYSALDKAFELGDVLEDIIEKEIRHYKNNDKIERALLAWNKFKDEV